MRILVISDIVWNFARLEELTRWVEAIHPGLVLLAGDLVNDMIGLRDGKVFSTDRYWDELYRFLAFLDEKKIQTFCVRGNWDYSKVADRTLKRAEKKLAHFKDISDDVEVYKGMRILGLSYAFMDNLKEVRKLSTDFKHRVDLVLTHASFSRRIYLFSLDTKLVITGHFDSQLCRIRNKVFISLGHFPFHYAVVDYKPTRVQIRYVNDEIQADVKREAVFRRGELTWKAKPLQSLRQGSEKYSDHVEMLMKARVELEEDRTRRKAIIDSLVKRGVPKRHIEEYLAGVHPRGSG